MITFDFEYYKPSSIEETVQVYKQLSGQGKHAVFYAGGTEIISLARIGRLLFDAAIDIKGIPELDVLEYRGDKLVIGAAVSLTRISDSGLFPFLGTVCKRAADHTARDKITLGGNICGKTPYKETILPLLLAESEILIAGAHGTRSYKLTELFDKELMLADGEFLVQVVVEKACIHLPFATIKKTREGNSGYPLVTVAATEVDKRIRIAFSGLSHPFRSQTIEDCFNNSADPIEQRTTKVLKHLSEYINSNVLGSAEYREFLIRNALSEITEQFGGAICC